MQVVLKIYTSGKKLEHSIKLGSNIAVGRSSSSDLQIDDAKISSNHCRFQLKTDRLEIYDLDSKNGTYLNGIRIENSEMFVGDEVKLGETIISIEDAKMEKHVIDVLTFPGPFKDRLSYELKADFTGARIQNQLNVKRPSSSESPSHEKEITLRKKIKSNLRLSKQEIRSRNKFLSLITSFLDFALVFCAFSFPMGAVAKYIPQSIPKEQRFMILLALMGACGMVFIFLNFKKSKFTIGEKVLGIQSLYQNQ